MKLKPGEELPGGWFLAWKLLDRSSTRSYTTPGKARVTYEQFTLAKAPDWLAQRGYHLTVLKVGVVEDIVFAFRSYSELLVVPVLARKPVSLPPWGCLTALAGGVLSTGPCSCCRGAWPLATLMVEEVIRLDSSGLKDWSLAYKVLRDGKSVNAPPPARLTYKTGQLVRADPAFAGQGYHPLCFNTEEWAKVVYDPYDLFGGSLTLSPVLVRGLVPLPPSRFIVDGTLTGPTSMNWPPGTIMAKEVIRLD